MWNAICQIRQIQAFKRQTNIPFLLSTSKSLLLFLELFLDKSTLENRLCQLTQFLWWWDAHNWRHRAAGVLHKIHSQIQHEISGKMFPVHCTPSIGWHAHSERLWMQKNAFLSSQNYKFAITGRKGFIKILQTKFYEILSGIWLIYFVTVDLVMSP